VLTDKIAHLETLIGTLDPASILQRGFTITTKNGKRITTASETNTDDILTTYLAHGSIQSKVLSHES
jgi:exonuclease VII large subunit